MVMLILVKMITGVFVFAVRKKLLVRRFFQMDMKKCIPQFQMIYVNLALIGMRITDELK